MSISAFPAFVEDLKVFVRERLNGYYGVGSFVVSNTLASMPFIALISICASASVYFIGAVARGRAPVLLTLRSACVLIMSKWFGGSAAAPQRTSMGQVLTVLSTSSSTSSCPWSPLSR